MSWQGTSYGAPVVASVSGTGVVSQTPGGDGIIIGGVRVVLRACLILFGTVWSNVNRFEINLLDMCTSWCV